MDNDTFITEEMVFVGQTAFKLEAETGVDLTGLTSAIFKYIKPDDTTGSFAATVVDALGGIIKYDVINTTDFDQAGIWIIWVYLTFGDASVAPGIAFELEIFTEGDTGKN